MLVVNVITLYRRFFQKDDLNLCCFNFKECNSLNELYCSKLGFLDYCSLTYYCWSYFKIWIYARSFLRICLECQEIRISEKNLISISPVPSRIEELIKNIALEWQGSNWQIWLKVRWHFLLSILHFLYNLSWHTMHCNTYFKMLQN